MRGRYNPRESNRDHRNRRQERRNYFIFNRRGNNDSFRDRRRNFIHQRRRFNNRPFKRGEKLNEEKLNQELDNYFEKKGGESLKDYLDNDLEMYKNKENLKKENVEENIKKEEKKEEQIVEKKEEEKKEVDNKVEEKEKNEMEVEEKKVEKKKRGRGKK